MADEISFSVSLSASLGGITANKSVSGTNDLTTAALDYLGGTHTVTDSGAQISASGVGDTGYFMVKNTSDTITVAAGTGNETGQFASIPPGGVMLVYIDGTGDPYFWTSTGSAVLEFLILEK